MKKPRDRRLIKTSSRFDAAPSVSALRLEWLSRRPLFLGVAFIATVLAAMSAQTGSSRSAEIHDHVQKAEGYLKANDPSSAAKEFDAVLALDPKNSEAYTDLGVIEFFQRDYQKASQYFRRALAIDPSLAKAQALLGVCQKRLGNPSARGLLEKSFSKLKDKRLRLQVGLELAALYDQQGDRGATASVMRSLVDIDPDNVDVLFMAQRVYSELADDTLNKLAILAPGSARMQQVIAQHLVNDGDLKGAIDHYRKALQIDSRLPGVHFELGEALLQTSPGDAGAEAEAQKEFELAVTVDGDTATTECEFGSIALAHSRLDQALAYYQRAYQLNPNEVEAQMGLANLLMMKESTQEAIKYLHMAVQTDPLNSAAHYQLGLAYRRLQMPEMAQKEMHLFQEIKKAKNQVQELYRQMNRHPKASADEAPDDPAEHNVKPQ